METHLLGTCVSFYFLIRMYIPHRFLSGFISSPNTTSLSLYVCATWLVLQYIPKCILLHPRYILRAEAVKYVQMQVIDRVVLGSQFEKYWLRLFILNWEIFSNSSRKYINLRSWCFSHLLSIHLALYHVESVEKKQACILYLRQGPAGVSSNMHLCVRKRCSASTKLWPMWELVQRMHKRVLHVSHHIVVAWLGCFSQNSSFPLVSLPLAVIFPQFSSCDGGRDREASIS